MSGGSGSRGRSCEAPARSGTQYLLYCDRRSTMRGSSSSWIRKFEELAKRDQSAAVTKHAVNSTASRAQIYNLEGRLEERLTIHLEGVKDQVQRGAEGYGATLESIDRRLDRLEKDWNTNFRLALERAQESRRSNRRDREARLDLTALFSAAPIFGRTQSRATMLPCQRSGMAKRPSSIGATDGQTTHASNRSIESSRR